MESKIVEQNRLKSPVVWASVVAQLLSILVLTGVLDTGLSDILQTIAGGILQLLATFGILNNPTDKGNF